MLQTVHLDPLCVHLGTSVYLMAMSVMPKSTVLMEVMKQKTFAVRHEHLRLRLPFIYISSITCFTFLSHLIDYRELFIKLQLHTLHSAV